MGWKLKNIWKTLGAGAVVALAVLPGCKEAYTTYTGPSYVMFADTLTTYPVQNNGGSFAVPVVATRTVDYDRNFAVEIVMEGSDAVYGKHYRLESSTVTILAGGNVANVMVRGVYDNLESPLEAKEPVLKLRLLSVNENIEWELYGAETKVSLRKSCPFDVNNFTGYCLVYSNLMASGVYERQNPRLIKTEAVAGEDNTILAKGLFFDGFDVKLRFDNSDLAKPKVTLPEKQLLGDSREAFIAIYGDGRMWIEDRPGVESTFYSCDKAAVVYSYITFSNYAAGGTSALVASDAMVLEWITDAEAEDYK
jgi:hypothetical protein